LTLRLEEARETLSAIRGGEVDALVVKKGDDAAVFTLNGADRTYRVLFESLNEGVITLSPSAAILNANSRAAELLGVRLEDLLESRFDRFVTQSQSAKLFETLRSPAVKDCKSEVKLLKADGKEIAALASLNAVDVNGKVCAWTLVL